MAHTAVFCHKTPCSLLASVWALQHRQDSCARRLLSDMTPCVLKMHPLLQVNNFVVEAEPLHMYLCIYSVAV
ncbi:hypothetical protein FKM82_019793 [Ascaphus truei]